MRWRKLKNTPKVSVGARPFSRRRETCQLFSHDVRCFTQFYTWASTSFLGVFGSPRNLQPRYNIAPTTTIDVVHDLAGDRVIVPMRWGLIPAWWRKSAKEVPATFNARRETIADKPMFRSALNAGRRCVIPISGFYEWETTPDGKQPFFISGAAEPVLGVAGLWERWRDPAGDEVLSATMIVQPANDFMGAIHTRMPTFVDPDDVNGWLSGTTGLETLRPASEELLTARMVSKRVNKVGNEEDATLIEAV